MSTSSSLGVIAAGLGCAAALFWWLFSGITGGRR